MNEEMQKELGRYFMDISKYIVTSVLISNFFSDKGNMMFLTLTGLLVSALLLIWGLSLNKKEGSKK